MTIELSLAITVISLAFGIYQGVTNMKRNKASDDKKEASDMTTIIIKLEAINNDTAEIKNDLKDVKSDVKKHGEQIIRIDESLKSAWKIINQLQNGGVSDGKT